MAYNVVGISGSPVKGGNVETFLQHVLDHASESGALAEAVHLSHVQVGGCTHCNFCLNRQNPGRYCSINDDAQQIFEKVECPPETPAAVVYRATWPDQKIITGTVSDVAAKAREAGIEKTALIIIGNVVDAVNSGYVNSHLYG